MKRYSYHLFDEPDLTGAHHYAIGVQSEGSRVQAMSKKKYSDQQSWRRDIERDFVNTNVPPGIGFQLLETVLLADQRAQYYGWTDPIEGGGRSDRALCISNSKPLGGIDTSTYAYGPLGGYRERAEANTLHDMKKPYTLALFAALSGDGSYQYTSQIWPENGDRHGSRAFNMTFKDENSFKTQVNATLAPGEDLAPLVAKLQKSKRFTWEHRMLADEQAVVFGWIS